MAGADNELQGCDTLDTLRRVEYTSLMPIAPLKRRPILRFLAWSFAVLLLLAVAAGAGGAWWLYGWRMDDTRISECRDPELQTVLQELDARLCSAELKAEAQRMLDAEMANRQQIQRALDEWNGTPRAVRVCRRLLDETIACFLPDCAMRELLPPYRALLRRAAEEGRADVSDAEGRGLLWLAIKFHATKHVSYLLEHGCDPNQVYRVKVDDVEMANTPFNAAFSATTFPIPFERGASVQERLDLIRLLCAHGADWNKLPNAELMWVGFLMGEEDDDEDEKALRAGLELGYRPDLYNAPFGGDILRLVGGMPHAAELAQELQKLGCLKTDLNVPLYKGYGLPLDVAVTSRNPAFVAWMLEQGADPNGVSRIPNPAYDGDEEESEEPEFLPRTAMDWVTEQLSYSSAPEEEGQKLLAIRDLLLSRGAVSFDKLPPRAKEQQKTERP